MRDVARRHIVQLLISQQADGLIIKVELKDKPGLKTRALSAEIRQLLTLLRSGELFQLPDFARVPPELLYLKGVVLDCYGQSEADPHFCQLVAELTRIRELPRFPRFRIVLVVAGANLRLPHVQEGLRLLHHADEVRIKLDVNGLDAAKDFFDDILSLARWRPVVIQSAVHAAPGEESSQGDLETYNRCLNELKRRGAQLALVQVSSPPVPGATSLSLRQLSAITRSIREHTGLKVEVY